MVIPESTMIGAFRAAAAANVDRPAIIADGRPLSYGELAALVSRIAGRLGPRPGPVGVCATHSVGTIAGLLAVWAAGGAYCPVDPSFPAPRRRTMLAAAGCRWLLDPEKMTLTALDGDGRRPAEVAEPGELAYVLFTSGSTGEPKPVLTPQRAIAAATGSLRELFDVTPADRVLQFASLNWDTCLEEILPALTSGAGLVLHRDAHSGSFPRLLRLIERERITVLDLPTAFWHELVAYLRDARAPLPGCVRLMVIGGEAASPARVADWSALPTGHARLLNTYGCTETTLVTHAIDLHGPRARPAGGSAPAGGPVPIGRALPHVVERIQANGELLIGGPALAAGYHGRPEATADRFITIDGHRYFRTGDRVHRGPDGVLVHRGRVDHELKIRGVRVDPGEVEAHIATHPAVGAVAVTGLSVADHTMLVAYVVPRPTAAAAGLDAGILDHLRGRVPAHLVPGRVHIVGDLVYTASGKVDRQRTVDRYRILDRRRTVGRQRIKEAAT
jgi:amino acid adenylation domain-containing protein